MNTLTKEELNRYSRQTILQEVGLVGQERLKSAKVLVVGVGGLGCPLALYLAAAGVGTIGLIDYDVVEEHNLQRQILYQTSDVGRLKTEVAKERLLQLNPHLVCHVFSEKLDTQNALSILEQYDIIADGTDNFPTRYLVNDACVKLGKTNVFASIYQFEGQLSVFNFKNENGDFGPNYRDLFPTPPKPNIIPNCQEAGVLGPVAGVLASMQGLEILKIIIGLDNNLSGYFMNIDLMTLEQRKLKFSKSLENPINANNKEDIELIDYDLFCSIGSNIQSLTVQEMMTNLKSTSDWKAIDIREAYELEVKSIGGEHLPLSEIMDQDNWFQQDKKLIIFCQSGKRTANLLESIQGLKGSENVFHVEGGINQILMELGKEFKIDPFEIR